MDDKEHEIICSFCAKRKSEVKQFVGGNGGFICNECVILCFEVMSEKDPAWATEQLSHFAEREKAIGKKV